MRLLRHVRRWVALSTTLAAASIAHASITLNSLFGDGMVLQRDAVCPMWGSATPNVAVSATIAGNIVATTKSDAGGAFKLRLPKLAAPGPYEIVVRAGDDETTLRDVLAGDVWLCSGQSNMQWRLVDATNGPAEVAAATLPAVRLYSVPRLSSATPLADVDARWRPCTPTTANDFSAVAYFFGRDLNRTLHVPIGLIHSSWGGTPAESWTPIDRLRSLTTLTGAQRMLARAEADNAPGALDAFVARTREWIDRTGHADPGIAETSRAWATPDFDDASWQSMSVPGDAVAAGVPSGSVTWFRRHFDAPATAGEAGPVTIELSFIDDFDQTFVNGVAVGSTGIDTPDWGLAPRKYAIPPGVLRAGDNVVAVRVHDLDGKAGLVGNAGAMRVNVPTPSGVAPPAIPLAGTWRYAVERAGTATSRPAQARPAALLRPASNQFPAGLYNGMIAPLGDLSLRGVIWYQGESNEPRPAEYATLLKTMIESWRAQFSQGDLPFYIVGLANYRAAATQPVQTSAWGAIREAQREVARDLKHVATTVTIDVGDAKTIHPTDKQSVGQRLANVALAGTYGEATVPLSPTLKSAVVGQNGEVIVTFDHVGDGLVSRGSLNDAFTLAGADGVFHAASARVEGDRVILSSPEVATPTTVRYAYADNPPARLFNKADQPAEPFETRVK